MYTRTQRTLGLLLGLLVGACSSWSGPPPGPKREEEVQEGRLPEDPGGSGLDGGNPDAAQTDGAVADAGRAADAAPTDAGLPLGDERADYVQCGLNSCTGEQDCCTTTGTEVNSACGSGCGDTEALIRCDGPEDCGDGWVCCHRFEGGGLVTECIDPSAPPVDGGPPPPSCDWVEGGPEHRVACHNELHCKSLPQTPLCRADERRPYLGYCSADTDDLDTLGHDGVRVVGCGDPDQDTGAGTLCSLNVSLCCMSRGNAQVASCSEKAQCGFSELSIACDGPEDCSGGAACCYLPRGADADGGMIEAQSVCAETCASVGPSAVLRCHSSADCGDAGTCQPDPNSPWWGACASAD